MALLASVFLITQATAQVPPAIRLPMAHYVQAPLLHMQQQVRCFGRTIEVEAVTRTDVLQIVRLDGSTGGGSAGVLKRINERLARLPSVVSMTISCNPEAGELLSFSSVAPQGGRNVQLTVYLMRSGVEFFPLSPSPEER